MYIISQLTGNIYKEINGVLENIHLDDSTPEYQLFLSEKDIVGVSYVESTPEEIAQQQIFNQRK